MGKLIRYNTPVSIHGIIICVLLIVSRFLGNSDSVGLLAVNQILVVLILCLCVHLIRRTSSISHTHVWEEGYLLFLVALPIFNLFITALQLVSSESSFISTPWFKAIVTVFSLPVFFCCYFLYAIKNIYNKKPFKITCIILWAFGATYFLLRLFDRTVFPLLTSYGVAVSNLLLRVASTSSWISTAVYLISIICFILIILNKNKEERN